MDIAREQQAKEYARIRRRLFFIDITLGLAFVLALLVSGLSVWLRDLLDFPQALRVALYLTLLAVAYGVLLAPLSFYGGYVLPHRYGLSTQRLLGWLADRLKAGLLSIIFGVLIGEVIYWLLGAFPDIWWLLAAVFLLFFTVLMANLAPVLILPLFFKLTPLDDPVLSGRLTRLAESVGARVRGVFTMNLSSKTTTANAALMGLGNTRRIVLGDTLRERYTTDEIAMILVHELAHHVHRDIPKLIAVQSGITLVGFYLASLVVSRAITLVGFRSIEDVAAFPLLALVLGVFFLLITPLSNAFSRRVEQQADEFALELTRDPATFISMMTKLADQNLAEPEPSPWVEWFFYDHPPSHKRIALAHRYAET